MIATTLQADETIYTCKCPAHHRLWHYQNALQHPRLTAISPLHVTAPQHTPYYLTFSCLNSRNSFLLGRGTPLLGKQSLPPPPPPGKTAENLIKTKVMTNLKPHITITQLKQRDY